MPDSKSTFLETLSDRRNSRFHPSIQPPCRVSGDEIQGPSKESGDTDSGAQENHEPGARPPVQYQSNGHKEDKDINIAISLLTECKAELSLANLDDVVFLFREILDRCPPTHPLHTHATRDLASALGVRFMFTKEILDLGESFVLRRQIMEPLKIIQGTSRSTFAICDQDSVDTRDLVQMTTEFLADFKGSTDLVTINFIVHRLRRSLARLDHAHPPRRFTALTTLADALYIRFHHSDSMADLNDAISCLEDAAKCGAETDWQRLTRRCQICCMFATRFDFTGDIVDLKKAFSGFIDANCQEKGASKSSLALLEFANKLQDRFSESGNMGNSDAAVDLFREGITKLHASSQSYIAVLFEQEGQQSDLDEAICFHRQALELRPSPHPDRSESLNNLVNALLTRFQEGGQRSNLDEAIYLHRQALELSSSHYGLRSSSIKNLAFAMLTQFQKGHQQIYLDEAISLHRQALELRPPPNLDRSESLNDLANTLSTRFKRGGQRSDLDEAICLHREALNLQHLTHPDRATSLNNLANVLSARFQQGGQRSDLDEAIPLHREALELRPSPHHLQSDSLNNLATSLLTRFKQRGQRRDLDEAISLHRQALELHPPPHPDRSESLNNLANALLIQFNEGNRRSDLDEAIFLQREGLELQQLTHPDRATSLNNLANVLSTRFQKGGERSDLDEATSLFRQALELFPSIHPSRASFLNNLANALSTKFDQGGQRSDLFEAISLHRQALELQPSPHPDRSRSLRALGSALVQAYSSTDCKTDFLEQAMSSFAAAMQCLSQSPSQRLHIAKSWIHHADNHQHICAIDAYDAALQALPQLAALSIDVQSRQEALGAGSDGLARDASRCAIRIGNLVKAIEFLEAGHSIFWSQYLSLRSRFDQLHHIEPQLADNLRNIATALELSSHRDISTDVSDNQKKLMLDHEASRLNRLNEEWENCINEVRKSNGFEHFLRPRQISELRTAALDYPVVILVANDDGSHCLILTSITIHHIDLPSLPTCRLQALVHLVQAAVSESTILRGETRGMRFEGNQFTSSDNVFKFVLRILWDEVVKPVLDFLKIKKSHSNELPVLQWCPTGAFNFLPIHAAGCYDIESSSECASNYFISSYTPTIGTLLTPDPAWSTGEFKMTVVIQSADLPSTRRELQNIERHIPGDSLVKLGVPGIPAKVEAVASCLSNSSIIHFACHGIQDRCKPLRSGLKLDDGVLRVSRIMKETMRNGSLAFLCACETGMGDETLPDEAMSLGASLLFSGFPRVIATMWGIWDQDGPTMADAFYEELFRGLDGKPTLEPDVTKSARALDIAVKKLRSSSPDLSFRRWVPFIHMGK